jgi:predicted O-methyltransferase YrrM
MGNAPTTSGDLGSTMKEMFRHVQQAQAGLYEGVTSAAQVAHLSSVAKHFGATRIAEIGFNIGYSAIGFLESSPHARVVSFELDSRPCVELAKEFIDSRYPGRHQLVIGDSVSTLPDYAHTLDEGCATFDLVFVDGSHEYKTATADIRNSRRIATPGAIVIMDDLTPWYIWGEGPTQAWHESVAAGIIEPLEYRVDGQVVDAIEGPADRAWAVGRFL